MNVQRCTNPFPRGEGAPVRTLGRKRNGEMLSAGRSLNREKIDAIPPAFLFSHRLTAVPASPGEKRRVLPHQCFKFQCIICLSLSA